MMKRKVNKSPSFFIINSMEKYLKVGKILKTQGLKGEVKVYSTTSFKDIRYKKGSHLFIKDKNGNYIDLVVNTFYSKGENLDVISFMDHDTIESVEPLLNHELFALKDDSILFDNEYFYDDLLNLTVFDEDNTKENESVGKIKGCYDDVIIGYMTLIYQTAIKSKKKPEDVVLDILYKVKDNKGTLYKYMKNNERNKK